MKRFLIIGALIGSVGCGERDPQNSAMCGITFMASGNRVLDQLAAGNTLLSTPPGALMEGPVPTRVIGHAASHSLASFDGDSVTLAFEGEGLPDAPGFGVALVDDSVEVFRGVLIFAPQPPPYSQLGSIQGRANRIPLFGMRIHWSSVNSEQCPLFPAPDTTTTSE